MTQSSMKFLKLLLADMTLKVQEKESNECLIIADEISFYVDESLSGMLATMAGFNIQFILQAQSLGQIPEKLLDPILTNCTAKVYYKIPTTSTLNEVEKLGGEQKVRVATKSITNISQELHRFENESILNPTRLRAMWYAGCAILVSEFYYTVIFIEVNFIKTRQKFDWNKYKIVKKIERKTYKKEHKLFYKKSESVDDNLLITSSEDDNF